MMKCCSLSLAVLFLMVGVLAMTPCTVESSVPPVTEQFTAILASVPVPPIPVELTDRQVHLVYEVKVTNAARQDYTLDALNVFDIAAPDKPLASFAGEDLKAIMWAAGSYEASTTLSPGQVGIIFLEITVPPERTPATLEHEFRSALGVARLLPVEVGGAPISIGPPLGGAGWFAVNVLGQADHRCALAPVNGEWHIAQRFAIDWVQADQEGYLVRGDPAVNSDFVCYGADLLAVEDGIVASILDGVPDQTAGVLSTEMPVEELGGNHIMLDIGNGYYVTYAHVKSGSLLVSEGDRVRKGQVLGKLGNSGHSSAPHLHFHVTKGLSPLIFGAEGVPFVFDALELQGQATASSLEGAFKGAPLNIVAPQDGVGSRSGQMPADRTVVRFAP